MAATLGNSAFVMSVAVGWSGAPMAVVNVLLRPFPFEVGNAMMLLSSVEITSLWLLVWWRRRSVAAALRKWRSSRFIAFALAFSLIYTMALGMMMSNLAIIARQRIFLFLFLFLVMEAAPVMASRTPRAGERTRVRASAQHRPRVDRRKD